MNILFIGDVVGAAGCEYIRSVLPEKKQLLAADIVIANGENSAEGNGITKQSAQHLFDSGVDVITTGNHAFRRREIYDIFDQNPYLIRPANYTTDKTPGRGYTIIDMGAISVCVINIMGTAYMDSLRNPFEVIDELLSKISSKIIIVDIHAEATAEKLAFGNYLDGRVTAVLGTHTHVQTADEMIFEKGTAYITDVGMTGPVNSCLGIKTEQAIEKFITRMPVRFDTADGPCKMNAVLLEIDRNLGKCTKISRVVSNNLNKI